MLHWRGSVNRTLYINVDEISFILFSESFYKDFFHFLLAFTLYHAFYFCNTLTVAGRAAAPCGAGLSG